MRVGAVVGLGRLMLLQREGGKAVVTEGRERPAMDGGRWKNEEVAIKGRRDGVTAL